MTRRIGSQGNEVARGANFISKVPSFKGGSGAGSLSTNGTWSKIAINDTPSLDNDGMLDGPNNRLVIKTTGWYLLKVLASFAANGTGTRQVGIYRNGASIAADGRMAITVGVGATVTNLLDMVQLVAGDVIELYVYQDSGVNLNVSTVIEATLIAIPQMNQVRDKPIVSYVTPAQFAALVPADGDECYLIADAANGVVWHMRYNAGSASAYKWEYLGGSFLAVEVLTDEAVTNAAYSDFPTVGPSVTVPRAGDYEVEWGGSDAVAVAGAQGYIGVKRGAAGTTNNDAVGASDTGNRTGVSRRRVFAGLAASDTLKLQVTVNSGQINVSLRHLAVRPVRIS